MKCPHCNTGVHIDFDADEIRCLRFGENFDEGCQVQEGICPECNNLIIKLVSGKIGTTNFEEDPIYLQEEREQIVFPIGSTRSLEPEVPLEYKEDFEEAESVISLSPKASAALSRRLLQRILREHFKIKKTSLSKEIDEFLSKDNLPSYLTETIDAVRNVGNFAAHPNKDNHTGEIVNVEPGEAEWLLDALEALFDFAFVQPKRIQKKKAALNQKLKNLGKPEIKSYK